MVVAPLQLPLRPHGTACLKNYEHVYLFRHLSLNFGLGYSKKFLVMSSRLLIYLSLGLFLILAFRKFL